MKQSRMPSTTDEVYVALVVVKRPSRPGQPALNPSQWSDLVLRGLAEQGVSCQLDSQLVHPAPTSNAYRSRPAVRESWTTRNWHWRCAQISWVYFGFGVLCLAASAYAFLSAK